MQKIEDINKEKSENELKHNNLTESLSQEIKTLDAELQKMIDENQELEQLCQQKDTQIELLSH